MQKTIPITAQMQKAFPLVIQNTIKDNFTWADLSRNAENAENDTLYCTNAENPSPSHTQCCQRQLHSGWNKQKCTKCRRRHPLLLKCEKPASPVTQTAIKDSFTWVWTNRNAENVENDTLSCANSENPSPSHTECYERQLHLGWDEQKCRKCRKRHHLLHKCRKLFP